MGDLPYNYWETSGNHARVERWGLTALGDWEKREENLGIRASADLEKQGTAAVHGFYETCLSVTFYSTGQFTPKMKANAEPRLLSSLV